MSCFMTFSASPTQVAHGGISCASLEVGSPPGPTDPVGYLGPSCRAGRQEGQDQDSGNCHPHSRGGPREVSEKKIVGGRIWSLEEKSQKEACFQVFSNTLS